MKNIRKLNLYHMYKWEIEELKFQIGKLIQLHRLKRQLSQLQLGNELNISSNHVGRIERAETNPTLESLLTICNFFEIDILHLFRKLNDEELKKIESEIDQLQREFKNQNKRKY
ncbi:helix-turn-helix transcriptional regulator [uncultured Chryseobacterium sp.]|uniref:helix-turn-helix domain-containing protein n=1 Tax=uncultured Chryseobacterium sp. TaxID=259322 RepID=UPI0025ECAA66|nr:helix-turn-helix transcriptional regulator [uncultured Chryseobacterium sp.]